MRTLQFVFIMMFGLSLTSFAAYDMQIKGQVLDKNTKEALPFANLAIVGTTIGVATDLEGNFSLKIKSEHFNDTLLVSMMGYENMKVPVKQLLNEKDKAVFFLAPQSIGIEELVIEGKPIILKDIFFELNKHTLLDKSYPALKELFDYVNDNPDFVIEISGHTDNSGENDYNLALSEARAGAVVAWLEETGIDQRRMRVKGFGEEKPIATNDTELGQQLNRRVEFRVIHRGFNPITGEITVPKVEEVKLKLPKQEQSDNEKNIGSEEPSDSDANLIKKPKAIFQPPIKTEESSLDNKPKPYSQVKSADGNYKKDFAKRLENLMDKSETKFHGIVGTSAGLKKAYGKANITYDIPNTVKTKIYIGDLAEHFTTVLALKLVEMDKMKLTDPISQYLPNYPNIHTKDKITIGHLLSHTSGLVNAKELPIGLMEKEGEFQHDFYIRLFATKNLKNAPGTVYDYSSLNYYLLAVIIEKVTEEDFQTLLQEDVFKELEMTETGFYDATIIDGNRAANYSMNKGQFKNTILTSRDLIFGSCNIVSTIEDLQKLDAAIRTNQLLKKETTKILFKENIKGYSFFGKIAETGQVKMTAQEGLDAYYHFGKKESVFIISNVRQIDESATDLIFKTIK